MAQFSVMKTYLREICTDDDTSTALINSTYENQIVNIAYRKSAEKYNWPQTRKRFADVIVAGVDRYSLPSDFRKFSFLYSEGDLKEETEIEMLPFGTHNFAIDWTSSEYILSEQPTTASTPYTLSNNETAASSVTIELDTISGLAIGDEIFINDSGTEEFTIVKDTDSDNTTIDAKLANNHTAGDILYKTNEIVYFEYYREITDLSADADTPILPTSTHLIIPYYAKFLYFRDYVKDKQAADEALEVWQDQLADAWLAYDKGSKGAVTQFVI